MLHVLVKLRLNSVKEKVLHRKGVMAGLSREERIRKDKNAFKLNGQVCH